MVQRVSKSSLAPGWYVQLIGEKRALDDWVYSLNEPFDPVAIEVDDDQYVLAIKQFAHDSDAKDIRENAKVIVARLNGAMAVMHRSKRVQMGSLYKVDALGKLHTFVFAEMAGTINLFGRATLTVSDANGDPLPPASPQPSSAQHWVSLAAGSADIADLLEQLGNADGWYEVYKTIEIAEHIFGGQHKLSKALGGTGKEFLNARRTANFFRHAKAARPDQPASLEDAKALLNYVVRFVLDWKESAI